MKIWPEAWSDHLFSFLISLNRNLYYYMLYPIVARNFLLDKADWDMINWEIQVPIDDWLSTIDNQCVADI